jgi:hypothetical protein
MSEMKTPEAPVCDRFLFARRQALMDQIGDPIIREAALLSFGARLSDGGAPLNFQLIESTPILVAWCCSIAAPANGSPAKERHGRHACCPNAARPNRKA